MSNQELNLEGVQQLPLRAYAEAAYLDYSMYVVLDRALPNIGDGLKPVHRRIIYSMSEMGLNASSKHRKSARTVGDVLGKFHPHGDTACYEAMVLLAQSFSYRYPLIDGQGNWGSPDDPKSFAAMRYTEARLTRFAELLLAELGQGTVDWVPNFDGTMQEPVVMPARLPTVLLNGGSGIAVGMATDIPPHNLREIAAALVRVLDDGSTTLAQVCKHIKGPDFPTEAEIITPPKEIRQIYKTGTGSVRLRARYVQEGDLVVVNALPFQVSGSKVLEQIAQQMRTKKLPMVEDLRDESDHENPTRLVIVPRSPRIDTAALMKHLFATTDLERSYRVNLNMIGIDGRPQVKDLLTILKEWLEFRRGTVKRRLQYRLDEVMRRLHVLEGLMAAYLNIDEIIAIIRKEERPRPVLMKRFRLSEIQADAILDLKLRHLARLEEIRIRGEQEDLEGERKALDQTLKSPARLRKLIQEEIIRDADEFGDARRSPIVEREAAEAMDETVFVPSEPVTVVLSRFGWVRSAKGHDVDPAALGYKTNDGFKAAARGKTNQQAVFVDSSGRCYTLPAHSLPSARGQGEPLTGRFNPPEGVRFEGVVIGDAADRCLMACDAGYGFLTQLSDLHSRNRSGKRVLSVPAGARALPPSPVYDPGSDIVVCATDTGQMLTFYLEDLPELARGRGNKLLNVPGKRFKSGAERMVSAVVVPEGGGVIVHAGERYTRLKWDDLDDYWGERAQRGRKLPRGFQKVDRLEVDLSRADT